MLWRLRLVGPRPWAIANLDRFVVQALACPYPLVRRDCPEGERSSALALREGTSGLCTVVPRSATTRNLSFAHLGSCSTPSEHTAFDKSSAGRYTGCSRVLGRPCEGRVFVVTASDPLAALIASGSHGTIRCGERSPRPPCLQRRQFSLVPI